MPAKQKPETEVKPEETVQPETSLVLDAMRKVMLASIGAIAITQEELEKLVHKLIERGEIAEKEGKKVMQDAVSRRKKDLDKAEGEVSKNVESLLKQINIPTKADVEELNKKIDILNKKLDSMTKE